MIAGALALWHLKVLVALLLLALVISSAMRPGVEFLHRHRIPRALGVAIHYVAFLAVIAFLLWLIVPRALDQVEGGGRDDPDLRPGRRHGRRSTRTGSSTRSSSASSTGSSGYHKARG